MDLEVKEDLEVCLYPEKEKSGFSHRKARRLTTLRVSNAAENGEPRLQKKRGK